MLQLINNSSAKETTAGGGRGRPQHYQHLAQSAEPASGMSFGLNEQDWRAKGFCILD